MEQKNLSNEDYWRRGMGGTKSKLKKFLLIRLQRLVFLPLKNLQDYHLYDLIKRRSPTQGTIMYLCLLTLNIFLLNEKLFNGERGSLQFFKRFKANITQRSYLQYILLNLNVSTLYLFDIFFFGFKNNYMATITVWPTIYCIYVYDWNICSVGSLCLSSSSWDMRTYFVIVM